MIELPKIYIYAFWFAAICHLFFMQKQEVYDVSYWHQTGDSTGPGHLNITVSGRAPQLKDFSDAIKGELPEGSDVVVLGWQKSDYEWKWKPIWKQ